MVFALVIMSVIYHHGYGYSKRLCEDISTWFLNTYFPRYKIDVEIWHRGLKREHVYGFCDIANNNRRPRQFLIELDTYMDKELYTKTLLHEFVHLKQWVNGTLKLRRGKLCYCDQDVDQYDYDDQPHEIEARTEESILYQKYNDFKNPIKFNNFSLPRRLL